MDALLTKTINTNYGQKSISVYACDITQLDEHIDIMTVSAFRRSYAPTPGTLIRALAEHGINVNKLATNPAADLRSTSNIWISEKISNSQLPIDRIGCVETIPVYEYNIDNSDELILTPIRSYFRLLETLSVSGIETDTIGIPVFGGGNQRINPEIIAIPIINECIHLLKNNANTNKIIIITNNHQQAFKMATALNNSYSVLKQTDIPDLPKSVDKKSVFLSYSSKDGIIADKLCAMLEENGMDVWYAPRNVKGDYASAIVNAISQCSHFVVILSKNSLQSNHVLNEIDLAFHELNRNIKFLPIRVDEEELRPAFMYYLSRQHWMDAHEPPLVERLNEFVKKVIDS